MHAIMHACKQTCNACTCPHFDRAQSASGWRLLQSRMYRLMTDPSSGSWAAVVSYVVTAAILVSTLGFVLETVGAPAGFIPGVTLQPPGLQTLMPLLASRARLWAVRWGRRAPRSGFGVWAPKLLSLACKGWV